MQKDYAEIIVKEFNPNPKCKNPKLSGDCAIRAVCKITNLEWDDVYTRLCNRGLQMGVMPNGVRVIENEFEDIFIRGIQDESCATVEKFILNHQAGSYYVCTKRHAFALIDGIVYDAKANTFLKEIDLHRVYCYLKVKDKEERK